MLGILGAATLLFFIMAKNVTATIVMALTSIAASVLFTTKDQNNISVVNQVGFLLRFILSQKYYPYRYKREYEIKFRKEGTNEENKDK